MSISDSASLHFEAKTGGSSYMSKAQARQLERIRVSVLGLHTCSPCSASCMSPVHVKGYTLTRCGLGMRLYSHDHLPIIIISQKDEKIEAQGQLVKKYGLIAVLMHVVYCGGGAYADIMTVDSCLHL